MKPIFLLLISTVIFSACSKEKEVKAVQYPVYIQYNNGGYFGPLGGYSITMDAKIDGVEKRIAVRVIDYREELGVLEFSIEGADGIIGSYHKEEFDPQVSKAEFTIYADVKVSLQNRNEI